MPDYFQDHCPDNICFGCGVANPGGLQIKSYWDGDISRCDFKPKKHHDGWPGLLCGGILATLMDCHCVCTAMTVFAKQNGAPFTDLRKFPAVTGTLSIKYQAPTSTLGEVELRAWTTATTARKCTLSCESFVDDKLTAAAEIVVIAVSRETLAHGSRAS